MDADTNFDGAEASALPSLGSTGLGSLANLGQQARTKQLKSAKWILIFVGVLMIVVHAFFFSTAEKVVDGELDKEIQKVRAQGMEVDLQAVADLRASAVRATRVITAGMMGLGACLCALGLFVYNFPIFTTVTGLIIYVGVQALSAFVDPSTIVQGIILKVLIIAGLAKAVQAALAYERDVTNFSGAEEPA